MTHFDIATLDGRTTALDETILTAFNRRLRGTLLRPNDGEYDTARQVWNGMIDRLIALNDDAPSLESTIDLWFQGGAMRRVAPDATAFGDRSAPILIGIEANWHDEAADNANVAWARRCVEAMRPFSDGSTYLNFPGFWEEGDALQQAAHGANYERLQAIKQQYDPQGLFARPAAATADTP